MQTPSAEDIKEYECLWPHWLDVPDSAAHFYDGEDGVYAVLDDRVLGGPWESLHTAIRALKDPCSLAWLDGDDVLRRTEYWQGDHDTGRILRHNGDYWVNEPRTESFEGPYSSVEDAAEAHGYFVIDAVSVSFDSSELSSAAILKRLSFFSNEQPSPALTVSINGEKVDVRQLWETTQRHHGRPSANHVEDGVND